MSERKKKLYFILALFVLIASPGLCPESGCYSQYAGCSATVEAIATAAALPR